MKIIKLKYLVLVLFCASTAVAQTSKVDKTFKTNKDVTVNIDARHTQVLVEYWDRNEVQVSAYLDAKNKNESEINEALQSWKLDLSGSATEVKITSHGGPGFPPGHMNMTALQAPLARLPELVAPIQEMVGPLLESISGHPLPPEFHASMSKIKFDYEEYNKDGEKYLKKFEQKMEKNFGKDFEVAMERWAENFKMDSVRMEAQEKKMEAMGKKIEKEMEAWGEQFGKDMEKWGEEFGKEMEVWASSIADEHGGKGAKGPSKIIVMKDPSDTKKVLRVKMPRNGQVKLNVRHGEVKLSGTTNNLRGEISHSKFTAAAVAGRNTNVKFSYTPVAVKNWNYGVLNAAYVQDLKIDKAVSLKLESNSSNVHLKELADTGILIGSFGELRIDRLAPGFKNLDISLENSELELDLPEAAYNITYNGTNSEVNYPSSLKLSTSNSYDNQKLKGYNVSQNGGGSINIHAKFSDVLLK